MSKATYVVFKWNDKALNARLGEACARVAHVAAEAGARAVRERAPGSIKDHISITERQGGKRRGAGGRFVKGGGKDRLTVQVNIKSQEYSGTGDRVPFHSVFPEWGTAEQSGQHFGLLGVKAMRATLDDVARGMLD